MIIVLFDIDTATALKTKKIIQFYDNGVICTIINIK